MAGKDRPLLHGYMYSPHAAQKVPVRGHSSSFFLISFPDLWLTSPLHVMTWHLSDDVATVWTSTALRANRYSCTSVWAEWVHMYEYARTGDGQRTASDGSWTLKSCYPKKYDCWAASLRKSQKWQIPPKCSFISTAFKYVCMYVCVLVHKFIIYYIYIYSCTGMPNYE